MGCHDEPTEGEGVTANPSESSDFFERLVKSATDAVVTTDADGTVVYANPAAEELLGYAPETLRGQRFLDLVPERFEERYETWRSRCGDGDAGSSSDDATGNDAFDAALVTATGDERHVSVSGFEHGVEGRTLFTGVFREAPEMGNRDERLRDEQALVGEIFDTSPIAFAVRDAGGELLRANDRATELVGVGDDGELPFDAESCDDWTVYDADGDPLAEEEFPVARTLRTGEAVFGEEIAVDRRDGSRVWLSVDVAPVSEDGEIRRVVSTAEEITELKRTQVELERRRDELETELGEVFDRVTDAFFALDDDWTFTYVNDTAEELLWRTEAELVGKSVWDAFSDAVGTTFQDEYERAMETQEAVSFVEYFSPLSAWFEVRAYPSETGLSVYFRDVSERERRERELERYETIVETTDDGIYILNDDMEFSMVNTALTGMVGRDREDLLGRSGWEFIANDEEVREVVAEQVAEMVAGDRTSATVEVVVEAGDGTTFPAEILFVSRETDAGLEHIGVVRDITEQKRRETELESRIQQQRVVSEFSQRALEDRPFDDLMDEAVELVAETLGHEYSKVLELRPGQSDLLLRAGNGWDDDVVGSATVDTELGSQAGYTLLSKEAVVVEDFETEDRFSCPDLLASHGVTSGISTVIGSFDEPWGILETHTSERRSYEDHDVQFVQSMAHVLTTGLRRRERETQLERYETIVETVEDGVYALDADERFVMVNDAFLEMTGYDRDELLGRHASVVHSDEVNERAAEMSKQVEDELGSVTLELELRAKNGETIPIESRFGPYRSDDGEFARTGVTRDITERKERERELEAQNERLDAFASMLAHELRNPLEIAQIYLDMGIGSTPTDPDTARSFREVEQALDRIEEMIDTLLVVTRRGGDVDTTETVDLGDAAEQWWESLDDREGTLRIDTDRRIWADPSRLGQLLENLFRNAVEHGSTSSRTTCDDAVEHGSTDDGETVTVRVGNLPNGFFVADDGPGIPADEREQVFEPGYSTSNVGIGFGLAVVGQLVEAHDWECEITESEKGGARFEFRNVELAD
ncbi:PAS domain S-box protein [Halorussus amylolyticus]|uniref:PAS domain S-box protein n=1 Tax=Halorussus amylolyticus TaxID=1126242 RepID=UPI001052155E|nr:PAS domain S-box protein [Halorussus amylolyticus]